MPHLFISLTAHGYGHLAQVAPVVAELARRMPGLRLTVQGDLESALVRARLSGDLRHLREAADPGLVMDGPLVTRWDQSLVAYEQFVAEQDLHLARQRAVLAADPPDLLLADVPWIPLLAARALGIPAVALSSLNWLDILAGSPIGHRLPPAVSEALRHGYAACDLFIRPAPSMPMAWLPRARDIGPIAELCPGDGPALRRRLGLPHQRPLVLVQFGGFPGLDPLADWPLSHVLHWVAPELPGGPRADASSLATQGLRVSDALGACDALIAKPGYGTFAEAACNGVPVLFVSRGDWPEEPPLVRWLGQRVPLGEIGLADLRAGRVEEPLAQLLQAARPHPIAPTGIAEAADLIQAMLPRTRASKT
jgi:UDP:flavonoid glycosyltransferase YjiC (YdhE family)